MNINIFSIITLLTSLVITANSFSSQHEACNYCEFIKYYDEYDDSYDEFSCTDYNCDKYWSFLDDHALIY